MQDQTAPHQTKQVFSGVSPVVGTLDAPAGTNTSPFQQDGESNQRATNYQQAGVNTTPLPQETSESQQAYASQTQQTPEQDTVFADAQFTEQQATQDAYDYSGLTEEELAYLASQQNQDFFPGFARPMPEELVYEWVAPSRPFKKRSKRHYTTVVTIALLIALIFFFIRQFMPVAVIGALVFLYYVMTHVQPEDVHTQITTYGIRYENQLYYWEEMGRFWFDEQHGQTMLKIEVSRFPDRLTLLLKDADQTLLIEILSQVLLFEKPPLTTYEKVAGWLSEKIPLDIDG
ncbi:hypothetical protein KC721_01690 [Candidatus Woesebacteria bacterium]|nr:hypothetical protein [Candidatus Woesebacteria bacterium]MCB9801560.1 hypothetical protein [Pseudomonadales bacterium]